MVEWIVTKFCKGLLYEKRSICVNCHLDPINVRITFAAFCTRVHSHPFPDQTFVIQALRICKFNSPSQKYETIKLDTE